MVAEIENNHEEDFAMAEKIVRAAAEEGVWHECLNLAALHGLPIIYVCENNLYSVYTPLTERQPRRELTGVAVALGALVRDVAVGFGYIWI